MNDQHHEPVVGVDLGGTNLQVGVVDGTGSLLGRAAAKTDADLGLDHVLGTIVDSIDRTCADAGLAVDALGAIGVAAAGAIDIPRGVVILSPNLGWSEVPLRELLEERTGRPVVVENDVNGALWAEYHLGAAAGTGDALGVWVGTGVGGGLVLGGRLHHGDFFTAGEIGHTVVNPDAPPGSRTVEELCSRTGMRAILTQRLPARYDTVLHDLTNDDPDRLDTDAIARAYADQDGLTSSVVNRAADLLGLAIANWVTMLAVRTVVIGGGITEALGDPWLARIRASFDRDVFPDRGHDCRLVMTQLAADAGLLGAALLARGTTR